MPASVHTPITWALWNVLIQGSATRYTLVCVSQTRFHAVFGAQSGSCFGSDDSDRHVLETASHPDIRSAVAVGETDFVGAGGTLRPAAKVDVEPLIER